MRHLFRAYPTLLRVGLAEAIAYRAELVVWVLTTTMPLVSLALWHAAAAQGPIGRYGQPQFTAYFFGALLVRQVTSSWVVWEMSREIRMGLLSMRLLRPLHPLWCYSSESIGMMPVRMGLTLPLLALMPFLVGKDTFTHDPLLLLMALASLVGAWLVNFLSMAAIGTLSFFIDSSMAAFEVWLAAFFTLSGYLFPLDLLAVRAPWILRAAHLMPFYSMNGMPVELLLGKMDHTTALHALAVQWIYVGAFLLCALAMWRAGTRRYNAFGA